MQRLTLISSPLCPFVQRAVIALKEKTEPFDLAYVDLADKPDWLLKISPLGKVPVLKVERENAEPAIVFESAVILEYLEETVPGPKLHPEDALDRAQHRSWIEFCSQMLGDFWRLTTAKSEPESTAALATLGDKLQRLEMVVAGPFFSGASFSNVDAAFAPLFRQIDMLEAVVDIGFTRRLPRVDAWRRVLLARQSVQEAVPADYAQRYLSHLRERGGYILQERD